MANPESNKKKVRGWKRRIREVEDWKKRCIGLDLDTLLVDHKDYVKLWIDPWYRLVRRNPPQWLTRIIFKAMVEIYCSWHEKLRDLNEPFYLKIWLYHPSFTQSQIVVAIKEQIQYYESLFDRDLQSKKFPSHFFAGEEITGRFEWKLHKDASTYWLSELEEDIRLGLMTANEVDALIRRSYSEGMMELSYGVDKYYKVGEGDVWIGEWRADIDVRGEQ
ncbi:hypothetical protein [Brevibacillus sp. NRS-1366]|uniref:hypothetical protein n=1 Tax=Brevibacillus sp. NRS-1366 TaxID=3233899 RepID=UPI003D1DFCE8